MTPEARSPKAEVAMYEKLKKELKDIVDLVESVPERYRDRCFDLLFSQLLSGQAPPAEDKDDASKKVQDKDTKSRNAVALPAKVRTFIRRYQISEEQLRSVVMVEDAEVHFVYEPKDVKVATGQIQWAVLLSLKSALLGGDMTVDPEDVRSICIEKGLYDKANFAAVFKRPPNSSLFNGLLEPQGGPKRLTTKGEERLAEVLKTLA